MAVAAGKSSIYLLTGASRGIGLEIARQLLARGDSVIATCRNPDSAPELQAAIRDASESARRFSAVLPLDVADEASVDSLLGQLAGVEEAAGRPPTIDVLWHNAGISAPTHPVDPVATAKKDAMMSCFATNAVGPLLLTQALLPRLRAGEGKKVFFVSTDMASCEGTTAGGSVSYRASKAAMNMVARCIAGEHGPSTPDGLSVTMCHPGWVETDMGSAGGRAPPVKPEDSVAGMINVMDNMGPHSTGDFLDYQGAPRRW